jgi:hypothetical protein
MAYLWNDNDVRHFYFDLTGASDWYMFNDAIAKGLGLPRSDEPSIGALSHHLAYQECAYHYHFIGWHEFSARYPRKSKVFLNFYQEYAQLHAHAFSLHLT